MGEQLVGYAVEFLIEAVFLYVALWIMIKIQKLEYTIIGLMGTAALASLLGTILDPLLGVYFSSPIIVIVLTICVWKLTRADMVDVGFTVGVGFALILGMQLFLLGALMGDLRPSARNDSRGLDRQEMATNGETAAVSEPVSPAASNRAPGTIAVAARTPPADRSPSSPKAVENSGSFVARSTDEVTGLTLKSVTKNGDNSMAIISTGVKSYTILLGEAVAVEMRGGKSAVVRFKAVEQDSAVLDIDGRNVTLTVR